MNIAALNADYCATLVDEWVAVAAHRQTRTFLPPSDACPLCPSTPTFAGEIPKGEYGGGTVMLWDRGYWAPEGMTVAEGLKKGDKVITASGIWGTVTNLGRETVTLQIADNTKIKMQREYITRLRSEEDDKDA